LQDRIPGLAVPPSSNNILNVSRAFLGDNPPCVWPGGTSQLYHTDFSTFPCDLLFFAAIFSYPGAGQQKMLHFEPFAKKHDFRTIFSPQIKAKPVLNTLYIVGKTAFGFLEKQTPEPRRFSAGSRRKEYMYASKPET
jgi:hypothetical protein